MRRASSAGFLPSRWRAGHRSYRTDKSYTTYARPATGRGQGKRSNKQSGRGRRRSAAPAAFTFTDIRRSQHADDEVQPQAEPEHQHRLEDDLEHRVLRLA